MNSTNSCLRSFSVINTWTHYWESNMAESTNSSGKAAEILRMRRSWEGTGRAGGGGVGAQRNRGGDGQEAESRGRGSKGLKEWEVGEIVGGGAYNAKKILYISQSKRAKGRKARKKGARSGNARNGVREAWTPCPPPPPHYFSNLDALFVCVIFWDKYRNFTYVTLTRFL